MVKQAKFCLDAIKKARANRDFPPSTEEIKSILNGSPLKCTVYAVGDVEPTEVEVTSNTSCGEIIAIVKERLQLQECHNGFGLFEGCGDIDKCVTQLPRSSTVAIVGCALASRGRFCVVCCRDRGQCSG